MFPTKPNLNQKARRILFVCAALLLLVPLGCHRGSATPTFDVPALIGKTIEGVQGILGTPVADTTSSQGADFGRKTWRKEGSVLDVDYKKSSGRVLSFSVHSEADPHELKDDAKIQFAEMGNLKEGDARYSFDYIESPDKVTYFSGVKVTPAPVNHKVQFAITGQAGILRVTYTIHPDSGTDTTQTADTTPPWKTDELSATTGASLSLQAVRSPMDMDKAPDIKLQIVVDGVPVRELPIPNSQGQVACQWEIPN